MDYDSDSELHATDRLRLESDSEDDNTPNSTTPAQEQISDIVSNIVTINEDTSASQSIDQAGEKSKTSNNEDDQLCGIQSHRKKLSKIIDSDSEDGNAPENTVTPTNKRSDDNNSSKNLLRLKSLVDSDSDSGLMQQENQLKQSSKKKLKKKKGKTRSPTGSAEGDTDSEDDQNMKGEKETGEAGVKIERKTQSKVKNPVNPVTTAKDMLSGLNLFLDDDDDVTETNKGSKTLNSILENDSSSDENADGRRRGKHHMPQMTEKQALEERQLIQSESQRMAREAYIDIPYHRTKAYSFEEFLARKTIRKPDPNRDCVGKASDLSIRMTSEQLEIFARQLKERELESQEFFKSESESSDEEPKKDDAPPVDVAEDKEQVQVVGEEMQTNPDAEPEVEEVITPLDANILSEENVQDAASITTGKQNNDPMDGIVNQTSENMETLFTEYHAETQPHEKERESENKIEYDLITAGPNEPKSSKKASLLATLSLPPCPRLSGHSDMIIDLDSGIIEPKAPTGADILFQRLAKCSGSANKSPSSKSTITVLSTDDGVVKFNKISLFTEQERPLVQKEPIPGAAFLKLKQTLKEKIDNDRRMAMRKREEEYAKKVEIEKAEMGYETDEEQEELLGDEECVDDESEEKSDVAGQQKNFANDEAMKDDIVDEAGENENDDDETSASSSSSDEDDQSDVAEEDGAAKRKGRIIKAFEDSDDESDANKHREITPTVLAHTRLNLKEKEDENGMVPWNQDDADNPQEDDLMELCSGRFATQLPTDSTQTLTQNEELTGVVNKECQPIMKPLYTQAEQNIGDSQLLELCSGRFETQLPGIDDRQAPIGNDSPEGNSTVPLATAVSDSSDILAGGKLCLESSDEETDNGGIGTGKKSKKRKRKHIQLSDDEDETNDPEHQASDIGQEDSDVDPMLDEEKEVGQVGDGEEDDEAERYVDYDSEENEVEVTLTKKDKKRIVANFVENEAELSESEWGSADEDEKDLDRYDVEMADEEQFDQKQLQQELEKIHNRQMLDQDNREVEQLKEFFLEDEENDGVGRVRQFRWKNVEKTFTLDYDKQNEVDNENEEAADGNASDEETELAWRKMRHERNMLLKEQNINLNETELSTTTLLNPDDTIAPTDGQENNQSVGHIGGMAKKKITIVKRTTTASTGKEDSPFLISKCSVVQGHKASFLSRDAETLNKLANLVKSNPETEGSSTVVASKGRNFVFTALSPAIEKTSKRSLDSEDAEERTNVKKAKTASTEVTSKKKLMLGSLM